MANFVEKLGQAAAFTAGLGAATLPAADADGGLFLDLSVYGDAQTLAMNPMYDNAAAVTIRFSSGDRLTASSVAVAPTVVIGAAHFTPGPTSPAVVERITFGSNYNTSSDVYDVVGWERIPGYVSGDFSTPDLSVYYLANPIPNFSPVTFADSVHGEMLTMVDYGNYGDPNSGELDSVGDKLAGVAPVFQNGASGFSDEYYTTTDFDFRVDASNSLTTHALNFSSGAPWYNVDGDLTLLTVGRSIGVGGSGYSVGIELNHPEVQAFLQPIIQESWTSVPEPGAAALAVLGGAILGSRRRRD